MARSKEFEYYVKTDLSKYKGKYVAIVGNKVVAYGNNAKEVIDNAKKNHPNKLPMLAKVPTGETLVLITLWK